MNIDLEQFKYVGELQITNDIENQSVTVYNRIDREPEENSITNDEQPKDDAHNDENDQAPTFGDNSTSHLENQDEPVSFHLSTQQNVNNVDEPIGLENVFDSQGEYQTEHFPEHQSHETVDGSFAFENTSNLQDETVYLVIEHDADNQQAMKVQRQHRPGPVPSGPHICENCGKSFPFKSRLKKHQIQESDLRSFKCPLKGCDSAFSLQHRLKEHLQKSHLKPQSEVASIIGECSGVSKKPRK